MNGDNRNAYTDITAERMRMWMIDKLLDWAIVEVLLDHWLDEATGLFGAPATG